MLFKLLLMEYQFVVLSNSLHGATSICGIFLKTHHPVNRVTFKLTSIIKALVATLTLFIWDFTIPTIIQLPPFLNGTHVKVSQVPSVSETSPIMEILFQNLNTLIGTLPSLQRMLGLLTFHTIQKSNFMAGESSKVNLNAEIRKVVDVSV